MAIVQAVKSFKYYLYGRHFIIRCDNAAVTRISKLESPGNRVTRYFAFLSEYNYTFEPIRSEDNKIADMLSRDFFVNSVNIEQTNNQAEGENYITNNLEHRSIEYPNRQPDEDVLSHVQFRNVLQSRDDQHLPEHTVNERSSENVNLIQINVPSIDDIKNAQQNDPKLTLIIADIKTGSPRKNKHYFLKNDLLMHKAFIPRLSGSRKVHQIVIPEIYRPQILTAGHIAHFGHIKTYNAIREKYFWEGLYSDAKHFVMSCKNCMSYKSPNKFPPIPIQRNYIATRPAEFVSTDFIGKLPTTSNGNSYILTFIDTFTKFLKLYAVRDQSAKTVAECLLQYACLFGFPSHLYSDKGSAFTSEIVRLLCKKLGVIKLNTTSHHPMSNSIAERIIANVKKSISIFAQQDGQWDQYLHYYELFYNNTIHTTTQEKPSFLQFSFDPRLPFDILNQEQNTKPVDYRDYVQHKTAYLQRIFKQVHNNITMAAKIQEDRQHKNARFREFQVGDLAYLYSPDFDRNTSLPKKRSFVGPVRVLETHGKVLCTVLLLTDPKAKPQKVNTLRLLPYTERRPELDYFTHLLEENSREKLSPKTPTIFEKPYAEFDDWDPEILYCINTQQSQTPNTNILPDLGRNCDSPTSTGTEIYDAEKAIEHQYSQETPQKDTHSREPYFLRSSTKQHPEAVSMVTQEEKSFAEKFLSWSLTMTESSQEQPRALNYLQTLSSKFD